ncbi:type I restriction enzyme, S subunit [Lachnospiraceae bacterium XBB2008]|nr:type I restriction enzyme, S subunit [Lachnospiraceae bacterium XBB2008]
MEYTKLKNINNYKSESINPAKTPDTVFEMYSVPIYETGHPEYLKGNEIASNKAVVKKNDILLCKINPRINRVWVVGDESEHLNIASSEWIVIRNEQYNPEYLAWYFRTPKFQKLMTSEVTGIGGSLTRAQPKRVAEYPVPVLDRNNQDEIVNVLNRCKFIIESREKELSKLDELIKARFVELFGDPITNPMGWKKEETNKHIDLLSGYPFKSEYYVEEGINICGGLIIMPQRIEWESCVHWPAVQGYEDYLLEDGDIVMALDRPWITEGFKVARVDDNHLPALLIQRTARIRGIDINQDYLYYCFINGGFDKHSNVTGSLVPHISAKDIRSFEIMVPPIELQEEFSIFMKQVDKSKVVVQKALNEAQLLFDSLMQEYFG